MRSSEMAKIGNTNQQVILANKDTKQITFTKNQFYYWLFTLSAEYVETNDIKDKLSKLSTNYCFQKEQGEGEYIHYQGFFKLKQRNRLTALKKLLYNSIHLEPVNNIPAAEEYCKKTDSRIDGPWIYPTEIKIIKDNELYEWEKEIMNLFQKYDEDRIIHWRWDRKGGTGKTSFAKYMCIKYDAGYVDNGKTNDIKYYVATHETNVYIFDFTRSVENTIPYSAIESIKNGIFMCGKYESKRIVRNSPFIICFSNFAPEITKLSKDRWDIKEIN